MKPARIVLTLVLLFGALAAHSAELVTLETRPGVEQKFILMMPEKPVASVILFAGGKGALNLSSVFGSPAISWGENNFLVRTRETFASQGLVVAVVDVPSDRQTGKGMLGGFRASKKHVTDIDQVITDLRQRADVPVWLVGTSRGTESAANVAINSAQQPHGLVLTSSMSVPNSKGTAVTEMELSKITIPVLIVAHSDDACPKTPPEGAKKIAAMLTSAPTVEVKIFSGGDEPVSKPCKAKSYHGFLGIEEQVVDTISGFIKNQLAISRHGGQEREVHAFDPVDTLL